MPSFTRSIYRNVEGGAGPRLYLGIIRINDKDNLSIYANGSTMEEVAGKLDNLEDKMKEKAR